MKTLFLSMSFILTSLLITAIGQVAVKKTPEEICESFADGKCKTCHKDTWE